MKINVTSPDGATHELDAQDGWRVMEVIKDAGLPMRADCGGCCACATCHVHVASDWQDKLPPVQDEEEGMLEESYCREDNSRLSCQLIMKPALDGLAVTIAEDAI